ncbi:hypothetical protein QSJ19_05135 [Gordonia sp. ABSL11-1]|uniref:hypothetical protein n=1 Tax=Gordonia sp. ABSL11-1 TaxID=3053924 RepID=UPI0025730CEA|nr:hypothetical protein [Gordonia sp. ABSL11-1]MDL9944980.1 hypothetical protein [Gordonia sp. ABSL11-1]
MNTSLTPVRAVGTTSHRVRGVGVHDHHDFRADDGTHIQITRWPTAPHRTAQVVITRPDGRVDGREDIHSSVVSVAGLLRVSGYVLTGD